MAISGIQQPKLCKHRRHSTQLNTTFITLTKMFSKKVHGVPDFQIGVHDFQELVRNTMKLVLICLKSHYHQFEVCVQV